MVSSNSMPLKSKFRVKLLKIHYSSNVFRINLRIIIHYEKYRSGKIINCFLVPMKQTQIGMAECLTSFPTTASGNTFKLLVTRRVLPQVHKIIVRSFLPSPWLVVQSVGMWPKQSQLDYLPRSFQNQARIGEILPEQLGHEAIVPGVWRTPIYSRKVEMKKWAEKGENEECWSSPTYPWCQFFPIQTYITPSRVWFLSLATNSHLSNILSSLEWVVNIGKIKYRSKAII